MTNPKRIALFPGTFDPMTIGHVNIIERSMQLFDEIHIGIGHNTGKSTLFPLEKRLEWIKEIFKNNPKISPAAVLSSVAAEMAKPRVAKSAKRTENRLEDGRRKYVNSSLKKHVYKAFSHSRARN